MTKSRLEAFSDGVIAIIITIMVLEMKVPHDTSWQALSKLTPVFLSYILSFIGLGIYWVNHHHLLHSIKKYMAESFGPILICFLVVISTFRHGLDGRKQFC